MPEHPWNLLYLAPDRSLSAGRPDADLAIASEDDCLSLINELFPERSPHFSMNRDDDCAQLHIPAGRLALSTDYFWEDAHFRSSYFTPQEAGAKALAVAVSDLAAAGAVPLGFSMGLMLPGGLVHPALRDLLSGMADKARALSIILTGGDLSRSPDALESASTPGISPGSSHGHSSGSSSRLLPSPCTDNPREGGAARPGLGLCITAWGEPVQMDVPFLSRRMALPGDTLFHIGQLGLAGVGLRMLERYGRKAMEEWPAACAAHLAPAIYPAEGQALAFFAREHACAVPRLSLMDCSDGLLRDLPRLLACQGADLGLDAAALHPELVAAAPLLGTSPEALLIRGGEDYALVGSCAHELWASVSAAIPAARFLGHVTATPGIAVNGYEFSRADLHAFDHFAH